MSTSAPAEAILGQAVDYRDCEKQQFRGLDDLARLIVAASKQQITPVLVTQRTLRLNCRFYSELCAAVHRFSGCHVRLELLPTHRVGQHSQSIADFLRLLGGHRSDAQRLTNKLPNGCSAVRTLALARNQQPLSELVIGCAGPYDHLPSYAKSIELCG